MVNKIAGKKPRKDFEWLTKSQIADEMRSLRWRKVEFCLKNDDSD